MSRVIDNPISGERIVIDRRQSGNHSREDARVSPELESAPGTAAASGLRRFLD